MTVTAAPTEPSEDLPRMARRATILVVDDRPTNVVVLNEILQKDYEVCMATSGRQALDFCSQQLPDLILLDVMMPEIDGYEVCKRLKKDVQTRDIPVIFVTAQNAPEQEATGLDQGAVDFIAKPVNPKVVQARVRTHLTLKEQAESLRMLAMIDGLTGIPNRRQFDQRLDLEWRHCLRYGRPLSVILVDIDYFKPYNDHYGHQAGDACIQAVAQTINASIRRPHDLAARYGGEEFVCVLPDTHLQGAQHIAENMMNAVRDLAIAHEISEVAPVVTISLGVACCIPEAHQDQSHLVEVADQQLYRAKQSGRSQVCALGIEASPSSSPH